jgi:hypothetical protein
VTRAVCWLFVVSAGILSGGSIFEHVVLTPLWTGSLPDSVRQWPYGGIQSAFFMVVSPIYGLVSMALVALSFRMPPRQRPWALAAGISGIVVVVATILFFLPILDQTQVTRGEGLSDEEIVSLVHSFETWNWGRWALLLGGWIAGLQAFSLSGGHQAGIYSDPSARRTST